MINFAIQIRITFYYDEERLKFDFRLIYSYRFLFTSGAITFFVKADVTVRVNDF